MLSILDKIFGTFNAVITFFRKEDNSIQIINIDNSTNITYSDNIPLPHEAISKLLDEKIEKIKDHAMQNIEEACKDKPEEILKYFMYNVSALSVAANTITAQNLKSWLYGETVVEPVEPMPSGDFIEQLPDAIDKITISEKVDIKIEDKNKKESS